MIAMRRLGGPGGVERRSHPRRSPEELAEPVQVVGSQLVDIGRGGLRLEAPIPLTVESAVHLRLVLGGQRTDVDARVRGCERHEEGRRCSWGVGLEFERLDPSARARLDRVLELPRKTRR